MAVKTYSLKYGKTVQNIDIEEKKVIQIIDSKPCAKITDVKQAVLDAIRNPIGTEPLRDIVHKGDRVCIVISDITRAWTRMSEYIPIIVEELNGQGVPDNDIFVIVATGTHRANSAAEIEELLGSDLASRLQVYAHDAYSEEGNVFMGTTSRGTPVYIDRRAVEADKVILTGGISAHLFAGFGGGRKSVMPGISGVKTVNHNHVMALSDTHGGGINEETCLAKLEDNRVHEDMCEVCKFLNPCFLVNVVMDADGDFAYIAAGHWYDAWYAGTRFVMKQQGVQAIAKSDIAITSGGGYPMDMNLYQGMKAYVPAAMVLKDKGVIIAVLECEDIAEPPVFFDSFHYDDLKEMENDVRYGFSIPFWVALYTCLLAEKYTIILVTKPENFEKAKKTRAIPVATIGEAMELAKEILAKQGKNDYTVNIVPHGFTTIPLFTDK